MSFSDIRPSRPISLRCTSANEATNWDRMEIRPLVAVTVLYLALLVSDTALAQYVQQGSKLVGNGASGIAWQGCSVAVSADGNTAIVGGSRDNNNVGAAWVWTRIGGVWSQQGTRLVGSDAVGHALQGSSVSLSADGNTAIVGGPYDNFGAGAVWVWTRSAGVWTQQGTKLVGSNAFGITQQGNSISLSADGNTAIVGGQTFYGNAIGLVTAGGVAWVWTRSDGVWTQQGDRLVGSGGVGYGYLNYFEGYAVSLSGDGNTAILGRETDNGDIGAVWIWVRHGDVWTQQGNKLVGAHGVGRADQGASVSLSADGNTAIVGGPEDNGSGGATWIWTRDGEAWIQQGPKLIGSNAVGIHAHQGASVSLSADGNTAVIGGNYDNRFFGAAWIWTRKDGIWTQSGDKLVGSGASGNAQQGTVSLSGDGKTAIVAGTMDDTEIGAAWVFVLTLQRRRAIGH